MQADRLVRLIVIARRLAATCLLLVIAEGCQQRPTTVSGTITLDGVPLRVASDARGTVIFQPAGGQGTMATGLIDSAGQFNLATGGSIEVAPGKYQVAVSVVKLLPKLDDVEQGTELVTPAKYAAAHESGLQAVVAPGEENRLRFNLTSSEDDGDSSSPDSPSDTVETSGTQPASKVSGD